MDDSQALAAVRQGKVVRCSQGEYKATIRHALQHYAGRMIDQGQDVYAQIALQEVRRLDSKFQFDITA